MQVVVPKRTAVVRLVYYDFYEVVVWKIAKTRRRPRRGIKLKIGCGEYRHEEQEVKEGRVGGKKRANTF